MPNYHDTMKCEVGIRTTRWMDNAAFQCISDVSVWLCFTIDIDSRTKVRYGLSAETAPTPTVE